MSANSAKLNDLRIHPSVIVTVAGSIYSARARLMSPFRRLVLHFAFFEPLRITLWVLFALYMLAQLLAWLSICRVLESLGYDSFWALLLLILLAVLLWLEQKTGLPATTWLFGRLVCVEFRPDSIIVGGSITGRCYPRSTRPMWIATRLGGHVAAYACSTQLSLLLDGKRLIKVAEVLESEVEFAPQVAASLSLVQELSARQPGQSDALDAHALNEPPQRGLFLKLMSLLGKYSENT